MAPYRQTNSPLELNVPPQKKDERKKEKLYFLQTVVMLDAIAPFPHPSFNVVEKNL